MGLPKYPTKKERRSGLRKRHGAPYDTWLAREDISPAEFVGALTKDEWMTFCDANSKALMAGVQKHFEANGDELLVTRRGTSYDDSEELFSARGPGFAYVGTAAQQAAFTEHVHGVPCLVHNVIGFMEDIADHDEPKTAPHNFRDEAIALFNEEADREGLTAEERRQIPEITASYLEDQAREFIEANWTPAGQRIKAPSAWKRWMQQEETA